jgi:hypothetical protein
MIYWESVHPEDSHPHHDDEIHPHAFPAILPSQPNIDSEAPAEGTAAPAGSRAEFLGSLERTRKFRCPISGALKNKAHARAAFAITMIAASMIAVDPSVGATKRDRPTSSRQILQEAPDAWERSS